MKKTLVAVTAGLLLVASQAVAANSAAPRVQDRLGQDVTETGAPAGAQIAGLPFGILFVAGFTAIAVIANDDDSDSD